MQSDPPISELERRLAACQGSGELVARVDALNDLAWALRLRDANRAQDLALEARELSLVNGYKLGQARAARVLGMTCSSSETLKDVLSYGEESRLLFDEVGDRAGSAASRDFLASIYEYIGDLTRGMELASEALAIAQEIDDPVRQGFALSNVGGILAASGDFDQGHARLLEALRLFEQAGNHQGIARISGRLAKLCRDHQQLGEAAAHAARALEIATLEDDVFERGVALTALADIEADRGHPQRSEQLLREALAGFRDEEERVVGGGPTHVSLARLLRQRGELAEAESLLRAMLDGQQRIGISIAADEAAARELLADVCEQRGDLAGALRELREVTRLRQRVAQDEGKSRLSQFEARAEMRAVRQESEIHRLRFLELQRMQGELVESEKLTQLTTLAAGTAHELNTPLGVLRSNLSTLDRVAERLGELDGDGAGPDARKLKAALAACRDSSAAALERIGAVVQGFKRFAHLDQPELQVFDLVQCLESTLTLLRPNLPDGVSLESELEPVPKVSGSPRQVNQAFLTVLLNASEAIDGSGVVRVSTCERDGAAVVRIEDTGRGMSEEEQRQLFDVGWSESGARTKLRMGLAAVRSTLARHGGTIHVESKLGAGTRFELCFPAHVRAQGEASGRAAPPPSRA